jgi:acyl-coenzyme A thioesterase PaaI-like protein
MTSDFLGPARLGDWVEGTARVTRSTESLVFVEAEIRAGGHAVMTASGIFRRIRPRRGLEAPATAD